MKKVACEICGGNLIKTGDLFECQSCGCSYTLDAVKKMVTGSSDDSNQAGTQAAQEKPKQVNNTVSIDLEDENMKQFSNHLELAKAALQARDFNSVVASSEKALELKPDSYAAWFYKAVSIGWLSTLKDNKLPQLIVAAQKAVNYAPDSEKFQIGETIFHEGKQIVNILFARSNGNDTSLRHSQRKRPAHVAARLARKHPLAGNDVIRPHAVLLHLGNVVSPVIIGQQRGRKISNGGAGKG